MRLPFCTTILADCVRCRLWLGVSLFAMTSAAGAQTPPRPSQPPAARPLILPRTHAPQPTRPEITVEDLKTRLYIFADDSMLGRGSGTIGYVKAANYLAAELKKIGLEPAGDNGTYLQKIPYDLLVLDSTAKLTIGRTTLVPWVDFVVSPQQLPSLDGVPVIYGGAPVIDSTSLITDAQAAGKVVVLLADDKPVMGVVRKRFTSPVAIMIITAAGFAPDKIERLRNPDEPSSLPTPGRAPSPLIISITAKAGEAVLGKNPRTAVPGTTVGSVKGTVRFSARPIHPVQNVVAILRGTDPVLKHTYVAVGAHSDHIGISEAATINDSARMAWRLRAFYGPEQSLTASQLQALNTELAGLGKLYPPRRDSIRNGADDDGSGSMGVLEIAQALAAMPTRPKRSILFIWHASEENGLRGSKWFVENSTVPFDSIMVLLNADMISRNGPAKGQPSLLEIVGAKCRSLELAALIDTVNQRSTNAFQLDYNNTALEWSDQKSYAIKGVPVAFFWTGTHPDYHKVTDEPQNVNYDHLAHVTTFMHDVTLRLGNLDHRLRIDKPAAKGSVCPNRR